MAIPLERDPRQLTAVVRELLHHADALNASRDRFDATVDTPMAFWTDVAAAGLLGLHVPVDRGGSGYDLLCAAVVVAEAGRVVAPGPLLPTLWASAVLATCAERSPLLPDLANGEHSDVELAQAVAWEAARAAHGSTADADDAAAVAATVALPAAVRCAQRGVQLRRGTGFAPERDAELYLRRALALQTLFVSAAGVSAAAS